MQHLVHLLNDRASSSYVALAGLHHNLLAHPHDRLPEGDVGEGSAHSAGTHFELHLHGARIPLISCAEEALLIGITIELHITETAMSNCNSSNISRFATIADLMIVRHKLSHNGQACA